LPSEAQWEYACRGGALVYQTFHFGNSLSSRQANFNPSRSGGAGNGPFLKCTMKVCSYEANAFGLYDMHGNVWEWCEDWFDAGFYRSEKAKGPDPVNDEVATVRVLRGGCWRSPPWYGASASNYANEPDTRNRTIGFRLAAVPCFVGARWSR
jgi:formylglycine-generating enzyme required for sulfatase activity